jgi:hypothetical protein
VDVFVRKVRQKLEKVSPDWNYIHTHFGVGYRFEPEGRDGADVEPEVQTTHLAAVEPPLLDDESATALAP